MELQILGRDQAVTGAVIWQEEMAGPKVGSFNIKVIFPPAAEMSSKTACQDIDVD